MSTVKHHLGDKFGLKSHKPPRKPQLTPPIKVKRYSFAKGYLDWTVQSGGKYIIFDDNCATVHISLALC